jgi:hypothetical protein
VIFEGSTPQVTPRFGSLCQWDAPVLLPLGLAQIVRNGRYTAQATACRFGLSTRLGFQQNNPISGLGSVRYLSPAITNQEIIELLAYTQTDGNLWSAVPFQQNTITQLTTPAFLAEANLAATTGLNPTITQAANMGVVGMTDLVVGVAPGLIYDPEQGTIDQISDQPFGAAWTPNTRYRVGQVVTPSQLQTFGIIDNPGTWIPLQTGYLYQCIQSGISSAANAQPAWPTSIDGQVNDNTAKWQECTPIALAGLPDPAAPSNPTTANDAGSPIAPGATVYLACTMVNAQGEGINELVAPLGPNAGQLDPTRMLVWKNNTANAVDLTVVLPAIPAIFGTAGPLGANFGASKLNLYMLIVPGTPNQEQYTDPSFYAQVAGGPFDPGASVTLSNYATGQELPTVNTAVLSLSLGNVPTGVRYMIQLFETRTDYQTGWTNSTPIRINVTQSGQQITLLRGVVGPYNCEARVFAFTVAGASAAGPYTYVDQADIESPGFNQPNVNITATRIPDNVTTTGLFNITDTYLPGASDVTNYANRILIPPFVDAYYSKTLQSVVYSGAQGYPSTLLISDVEDPQAVRIPGSNLDVAINDGDRAVCYREVRNIGICFKENSGHVINSNDGDPSTWAADELWQGMGLVGPKAIAVSAEDNSQFAVFAHRSGLYLYEGGAPKLISREMYTFWNQINWAYGHLIVVKIDETRRQLRISVPLNGATACNAVFTMYYFFGVGDPVVFITRTGHLVPNPDGRKWSVDDIIAPEILYVPQRSKAEAQQAGVDISNEMIFACADGSLKTVTDNQYYDEDFTGGQVGFFGQWIGVPGANPNLAVFGLVGASCSAVGSGLINVYAVDDKYAVTGKLYPLSKPNRLWRLTAAETQRDFGSIGHEATRWGIGFDNGGVAGAWWEMHTATLWIIKKWSQRAG